MLSDFSLPKKLQSKDKKLNAQLEHAQQNSKRRNYTNKMLGLMNKAEPGYLEPDQGEQTLRVRQEQIGDLVNLQTASYQFQLDLPFGDYKVDYTRNGSTMMLSSSMGHVSLLNWRDKELILQINLHDKIRAGTFLHSQDLFALAQKQNLFIYDKQGTQIHKLPPSLGLQYLPYHFLLASRSLNKLSYYDTSTGYVVAEHTSRQPYTVIRQNRSNAVVSLGTAKGTVEWWTPGMGRPAVQVFVGASVVDVGYHKEYMVTATNVVKVWDTRRLEQPLHVYPTSRVVSGIEISATGLLAVNYGFEMEVWKDAFMVKQIHPYMKHPSRKDIRNMRFVPFQDIMGLGLTEGFSSIVVPGSGDPNYDTYEVNPFESKKQKRQSLVHKLLDKLSPETITVDPSIIGTVDRASKEVIEKQRKQQEKRLEDEKKANKKQKRKTKGRNTIINRVNNKMRERDAERRRLIGEAMDIKLLAKRAQKAKKQTQLEKLQELDEEGFDPVKILRKKPISKLNS